MQEVEGKEFDERSAEPVQALLEKNSTCETNESATNVVGIAVGVYVGAAVGFAGVKTGNPIGGANTGRGFTTIEGLTPIMAYNFFNIMLEERRSTVRGLIKQRKDLKKSSVMKFLPVYIYTM